MNRDENLPARVEHGDEERAYRADRAVRIHVTVLPEGTVHHHAMAAERASCERCRRERAC